MGLLSQYVQHHWEEKEELIKHLPEVHRKRGLELIAEGKIISNANIGCALYAADIAGREINTSILLRTLGLGFHDLCQRILNFPSDDWYLFGPKQTRFLKDIKKDRHC